MMPAVYRCFQGALLVSVCAESAANSTYLLPAWTPGTVADKGEIPMADTTWDAVIDPNEKLRRHYNLQDFLWVSSGDGPAPSEDDGGLAWEDNGGPGSDGGGMVQITTTKTLFKTVLSTIYPVEVTPTLIFSSASTTGRLLEITSLKVSPSPSIRQSERTPDFPGISPTPVFVEPSVSVSTEPGDGGGGGGTTPQEPKGITPIPTDVHPEMDRMYWVQTVIKANRSVLDAEPQFQCLMQNNLAKVYASAFKRHLLNSLGVFDPKPENLRRKRSNYGSFSFVTRDEADSEWLYPSEPLTPSRMRALATATTNVTVTILNITQVGPGQHVGLNYVVFAEGNPVLAASAVQDLHLVTRQEMEKEIGYEVINKAEALVASPLQETKLEEATSPWLIVAVTTIILMVVLIVIIIFMVWKWKHNRLSDTIIGPARPQSGIEEGVINPAFLGPPSPIERSGVRHDDSPGLAAHARTVSTHVKTVQEFHHQKRYSSERRAKREKQEALASELNALLARQGEKLSPSSVESLSDSVREDKEGAAAGTAAHSSSRASRRVSSGLKGSSGSGRPRRKTPSPRRMPSDRSQTSRRRQRQQTPDSSKQDSDQENLDSGEEGARRRVSGAEHPSTGDEKSTFFPSRVRVSSLDNQLPEMSARSMEKISFGNLDVCQESLARPISAKARKLLPKGSVSSIPEAVLPSTSHKVPATGTEGGPTSSAERKYAEVAPTVDEITDILSDEERKSIAEQDRDIGESVENISAAVAEPTTKDAQVQTPTRRPRPKPKPRKRQSSQLSSESLISTESEEIIHEFEASPGDANPMGRMRKRFHQFLDDAFNIMGKRDEDGEDERSKSARVSISHHVETRERSRPWTSQTVREESLHRLRPKSASFGPPKRAWGSTGSERRCRSAKSGQQSSKIRDRGGKSGTIFEGAEESEQDDSDLTSTPAPEPAVVPTSGPSTLRHQVVLEPIFPNYPIYPDIPVTRVVEEEKKTRRGTTRIADPAVPLILAIKEEIKRFEKVKATDPPGGSSAHPDNL